MSQGHGRFEKRTHPVCRGEDEVLTDCINIFWKEVVERTIFEYKMADC
jgi:hypothetical protein